MDFSSDSHRLTVIDGDSLITGARVLVHGNGAGGVGRFTAWPDSAIERSVAVRVIADPAVARDRVVLPHELANELDLGVAESASWRLVRVPLPQALQILHLEALSDTPVRQQARAIEATRELSGLVLLRGTDPSCAEGSVRIGSQAYRIAHAVPAPTAPVEIHQVTAQTKVRLISSNANEAYDIVILADTSGSMSIADLEVSPEEVLPAPTAPSPAGGFKGMLGSMFGGRSPVVRTPRLSRIDALQRALGRMIDLRASSVGRGSRFALLRFATSCVQVFPSDDGMAEVDADTDPETVAAFRRAVGMLQPEGATDIGSAIYRAFDLLHRHHRPNRSRLILLVSDGANAPSYSASDTGREIGAIEDPVQLLRRLSQHLDVKLLSIGISDSETFTQWVAEDPRRSQYDSAGFRPDHELLTNLMRVCGAEQPNPGSAEDLIQIFSELGSGVSEPVRVEGSGLLPALSSEERMNLEALSRRPVAANASMVQQDRLRDAVKFLQTSYYRFERAFGHATGNAVAFDKTRAFNWVVEGTAPAVNEASFRTFIVHLHGFLREGQTEGIRVGSDGRKRTLELAPPWDVCEGAAACLADGRLRSAEVARNFFSHSYSPNADTRQKFNELLERSIGTAHVEPDDAEKWSALQLFLLGEVGTAFEDAYKAVVDVIDEQNRRRGEEPEIPLPMNFSW